MNILLVGCTGFLGKSLIHYFITHTSHHLMVVIRPKHQLTINERLQNILNELNIKEQKRIVPVKVTYDDSRTIIMDNKDKIMIQRKVHVLINALADVKFNRPLQKATLNNTVTALNWMFFFQKCQHPVKYIYVSSAFVNFHITNDGIIEDAKFKTYGCGSTITSSSLVTEWVKGKTLDEAQNLKNTEIVAELSLPPVKIHCSVLAEDAIKAAISDYKGKYV